jgi:general secretion pathway protein A
MYEAFYGFRENPFRLTPDPDYLFLSANHQEALGHLLFGANEGNGVVIVTGEIGTGKTTLLRTLVRNLGPDTIIAYIFNPALSALELLQTINTDLNLPATSDSKKELIDTLNRFLLGQRSAGKRVVVIIDEAQDLEPGVLEQLRLLSNLETEREKLLQIILVGQPELSDLLAQPTLAQLDQRITLRWHLGPLNAPDTAAYVRHRISAATEGREPVFFSPKALQYVYRFSGGIPRVINVLCHRTLLVGYTNEQSQIDGPIVRQAAKELRQDKYHSPHYKRRRLIAGVGMGTTLVLAITLFFLASVTPVQEWWSGPASRDSLVSGSASSTQETTPESVHSSTLLESAEPPQAEAATALALAADAPHTSLANENEPDGTIPDALFLQALQHSDTVASAVHATGGLLRVWQVETLKDQEWQNGALDLVSIARARQLEHLEFTGNLSLLSLLDLPIVVELVIPDQQEMRFVLVVKIGKDRCRVLLDREYDVSRRVISQNWFGKGHVFWKDFEELGDFLAVGHRGKKVKRLHSLLSKAQVLSLTGTPPGTSQDVFSPDIETAVVHFQKGKRLTPDGVVGPLTMILLYNAVPDYQHPRLGEFTQRLAKIGR